MHHDLISCTVALNGIYNGKKLLTSSSARLRGNPIIYTRFRWITLTSLRCFLPSEAFGFDFCSFCFRSKFLSATNLFSRECHDVTQQLIKLYKTNDHKTAQVPLQPFTICCHPHNLFFVIRCTTCWTTTISSIFFSHFHYVMPTPNTHLWR